MDREKTIDCLKEAIEMNEKYGGFDGISMSMDFLKGIYDLVKEQEQEPIKPIRASDEMECTWYYVCPKCKIAIDYKDKYCRHCGSEMSWDE